jgi:hypothetical protein
MNVIKTGLFAVALAALISTAAQAQIANGVLKIGVLDDQSEQARPRLYHRAPMV